MAISIGSPVRPSTLTPVQYSAPNVVADSVPGSGTLRIVDDFEASPGLVLPPIAGSFPAVPPFQTREVPHGVKVTSAARETGYQGPIQVAQNPLEPSSIELLVVPDQSAESTLANLDKIAQFSTVMPAQEAARIMRDSANGGVSQTVTNFSWGNASADTVNNVYQRLRSGWTPPREGEGPEQITQRVIGGQVLDNLARAFDVSLEDLKSQESQVSGPARQELQQHLIDRVEQANRHELLDERLEVFRSLVDSYEANHNSLVVAAGNQGQLLELMEADNGGRPLYTGPDFFTSVLAVPNATVVGALGQQVDGTVGIADYSSSSPAIDVNAWGRLDHSSQGTSFAAPRVAAVMQQLHIQHPTATSAEVEQMMIERLFQQSPSEPPNAVREYMRSQTW